MDVFVYDRDLNLIHVIDDFNSLIWTRKYNKLGTFELYVPFTTDYFECLKIGNIIRKEKDLEGAVIEGIEITLDQTGKELIKIYGSFLNVYLSYRIQKTQYNYTNKEVESIIREMFSNEIISLGSSLRKIPNYYFYLDDVKGFTEKTYYQSRYGNVFEEISALTETFGMGFKTTMDLERKELRFELYKGIDRSTNQNEIAPCIFSRDYENILNQKYTKSITNSKNVAYSCGEGEGIERKYVIVNDSIMGLDRHELYVDARDLRQNDGETILTDSEYNEQLTQRGKEKLEECKSIETLESTINPLGNNKYKNDYNLGDIITVIDAKIGIKLDTRISEIQEVYENGKMDIYLTFGNTIPTIYDKLKKI